MSMKVKQNELEEDLTMDPKIRHKGFVLSFIYKIKYLIKSESCESIQNMFEKLAFHHDNNIFLF